MGPLDSYRSSFAVTTLSLAFACGSLHACAGRLGGGECTPGASEPCGSCLSRVCGEDRTWGPCEDDDRCSPCGDRGQPCCGDGCDQGLHCFEGRCTSMSDAGADADTSPGDDADADADADTDGTADSGPDCAPVDPDAALIFYYGVMRTPENEYYDELNTVLTVPGLDVVFTVSGASKLSQGEAAPGRPESGEFKEFHDRCARLAYTVGIATLTACFRQTDVVNSKGETIGRDQCSAFDPVDSVEGTALFLESKLAAGWDYIDVDEIKFASATTPDINYKNGSDDLMRLEALLDRLAEGGHDRKMILWFAPGTTDIREESAEDPLRNYTELFELCKERCRRMIFEAYQSTTEIEAGGADRIERLAERLHELTPGANRVSMAGLAVGSSDAHHPLDDPLCDLSPWEGDNYTCPAPLLRYSGGLLKQLGAMHDGQYARYWWGVGFYSLGEVETSRDGSPHAWNRRDFAESTAHRVSWWKNHDPP